MNLPASQISPVPLLPVLADPQLVFRGVDWYTYNVLSEANSESQHVHLAYDGKSLEIVVTSNLHENWKELLIKIVNAITSWLDIDCVSCGEATWKTHARGLEADLSYYFDPEKIRAAREALARQSMKPADYPRPDLAIEVDLSNPQIDRSSIYAELGVVEVWRYLGARRSSSSSSRRTGLMRRSRQVASCGSGPRTFSTG